MANELKHKDVGDELTKTEFHDVELHVFDSQAAGDIPYASSATQLSRLAKGTDGDYLKSGAPPAWEAHKDITTGVHGAGANYIAHFGQENQVVSKIIWKDASESAMADSDRTSSLDWTDLDLTATTSANAKIALLELFIRTDSYTSGNTYLSVRKNGTTPDQYPMILADTVVTGFMSTRLGYCLLGLDSGQVVEYSITLGTTTQVDTGIRVLGYVE